MEANPLALLAAVVIGVGLLVLVPIAASNRGRDGIMWFILALCITPVLALLLILILGKPAESS